MSLKNYLSTEMGQQTFAGFLTVLAFPVITTGLALDSELMLYAGFALIVTGMGMPPFFMFKTKNSK